MLYKTAQPAVAIAPTLIRSRHWYHRAERGSRQTPQGRESARPFIAMRGPDTALQDFP
jgi:hypothetical protein